MASRISPVYRDQARRLQEDRKEAATPEAAEFLKAKEALKAIASHIGEQDFTKYVQQSDLDLSAKVEAFRKYAKWKEKYPQQQQGEPNPFLEQLPQALSHFGETFCAIRKDEKVTNARVAEKHFKILNFQTFGKEGVTLYDLLRNLEEYPVIREEVVKWRVSYRKLNALGPEKVKAKIGAIYARVDKMQWSD